MIAAKHTPLVWGQRVTICDETHSAFGRVGRFEGVIVDHDDCLRVRLPGCIILAARDQLLSVAHPVCARREVKEAGIRQRRERWAPTPTCYLKDYGLTSLEAVTEAYLASLNGEDEKRRRALAGEMMYRQRQEWTRKEPRRCRRADVRRRRNAEARDTARWLRTRKGLRRQAAIAKATGGAS